MRNEDARTVVQLLADHELALKELYQTYAATLPSRQDLWLKLAADEQRHYDWLEALRAGEGDADSLGACRWPRPPAIESSLKYLRGQIVRARQAEVALLVALAVAKDLETALLEKEFFKVAEGASPEVRAVLGRLSAATEQHQRAVVDALNTAKRAAASGKA